MSEQNSLERLVADQLANAGVGTPPESAIEDTISRATKTRRDPRWLALIKEPPMRTNSHLAVGSPTARVAAVAIATLLLAVAVASVGVAGQRLLAASDTIVVDQSGAGDFTTINEAVEAASDGDTISIMPGRYAESVAVMGKDLEILGDGDRDDIIIEATSSVPPVSLPDTASEPFPFAILLADTGSRLANVTIIGRQDGTAVPIVGADTAPELDGIVVRVQIPERTEGYVGESVAWAKGSSGTLTNSVVEGTVGLYSAEDVVVADNDMPASCIEAQGASGIQIRGNTIHGCIYEMGISVSGDSSGVIEGNDIMVEDVQPPPEFWRSDGRIGIQAGGEGKGVVTIRDNDIHGSRTGIMFGGGDSTLEITGNRLSGNDMGIARIVGSPILSENTITGSAQIGLEFRDGAATVEGNTITDNFVGLSLAAEAAPMLKGNTICDNATNVRMPDDREPLDGATNEICEDTDSA